jgi:hypothetical protein
MNYKIAIPTLGRCDILLKKTLATLQNFNIDKSLIYIFVIEEEYDNYKSVLDDKYNIIIGVRGLVKQREFIENYFEEGDYIVMLDDDIAEIDLSMTEFDTLDEFFNYAFNKCKEEKSFIWSVYPVYNPFFRKNQNEVTTHLNYCVGAFYGIINRPNYSSLKIDTYLHNDEKEDVCRTLLYFINDGVVLRFNKIGFKTTYYANVGGMGKKKNRLDAGKIACQILQHFAEYGKVSLRKSGIHEFKLKKIKSFNSDRSVTLLPKIDNILIDNLYNELQKITVKQLGKSNVRLNFKAKDRSVVFGTSRGRFNGVVALSSASKKYPHIWDLLQQIGNQLPKDFEYNSVFLNHNVVCQPHKDKNNVGKSILISFGEYSGCNIFIDGIQYDANRQPVLFNGSLLEHYNTDDLVGNKYSLVFFKGNY